MLESSLGTAPIAGFLSVSSPALLSRTSCLLFLLAKLTHRYILPLFPAKRNFRMRHSHGRDHPGVGRTGTQSNSGDASVSTSLTSKKVDKTLKRKFVSATTGGNTSDNSDSIDSEMGLFSFADVVSRCSSAECINSRTMVDSVPSGAGHSAHRTAQWAALLERRPSSGESNEMAAWLLEVIKVSDGAEKAASQGHDSCVTDDKTITSSSSSRELMSRKRGHSLTRSNDSFSTARREDDMTYCSVVCKKHKGLSDKEEMSP